MNDYLYIGELLYVDCEDGQYDWEVNNRVFVTEIDGSTCYCVDITDSSKSSWLNTKQIKIIY